MSTDPRFRVVLPELPTPQIESRQTDSTMRTIAVYSYSADQMYAYALPLAAEIARLTAELEEARKDAWQPIETAPQSRPILLWWRTARTPMTGRFVSDERGEGWMCDGDRVLPRNQNYCTHWMPLPKSPAAAMTKAKPPLRSRPLTADDFPPHLD
jgi:hypothetical protein